MGRKVPLSNFSTNEWKQIERNRCGPITIVVMTLFIFVWIFFGQTKRHKQSDHDHLSDTRSTRGPHTTFCEKRATAAVVQLTVVVRLETEWWQICVCSESEQQLQQRTPFSSRLLYHNITYQSSASHSIRLRNRIEIISWYLTLYHRKWDEVRSCVGLRHRKQVHIKAHLLRIVCQSGSGDIARCSQSKQWLTPQQVAKQVRP